MKRDSFETPVILLLFNRPETTRKVFEKVAELRPKRLFLVADGPRDDRLGEARLCAAARQVVQSVDWDCAVETDFSATNLGLKKRVSSGLGWAFSRVDQAIILEDDCVPNASFFRFCHELLARYRDDRRVMMIGGTNYQFGRNALPYSYYFSIYTHIWGWATWASAWDCYDGSMALWPKSYDDGLLESLLQDARARRFWAKRFQATYRGQVDTWDYCWTLSCWLQGGLSIVPSVNMVSNIGFGKQATHTLGHRSPFMNMPTQEMDFPLSHPPYIARFPAADQYTQQTVFREHLLAPLKKRIKQILKI